MGAVAKLRRSEAGESIGGLEIGLTTGRDTLVESLVFRVSLGRLMVYGIWHAATDG